MLSIVTYPNPILDQKAQKVSFPLNQATQDLIKNMWATVRSKGVGLAAPQVGVSKQICIINLASTEKGAQAKDILMINPVITFYSEMEYEMVEGCLSFPGEYYKIWRPANITVEYRDERGKKRTLKAKEWLARVIQHEVDHLNGNLFIHMDGDKIPEQELSNTAVVD